MNIDLLSPRIMEIDSNGKLAVTVHDSEAVGFNREATEEETKQAILYWIKDIYQLFGIKV